MSYQGLRLRAAFQALAWKAILAFEAWMRVIRTRHWPNPAIVAGSPAQSGLAPPTAAGIACGSLFSCRP